MLLQLLDTLLFGSSFDALAIKFGDLGIEFSSIIGGFLVLCHRLINLAFKGFDLSAHFFYSSRQLHHALFYLFTFSLLILRMAFDDLQLPKILIVLLPQNLDVVDSFGVLHRFEDLIKLLLQYAWLTHRPETLILMAENDIVQDSLRDTQVHGHHLIQLGHSGRYGCSLTIGPKLQLALQSLHLTGVFLDCQLKTPTAVHLFALCVVKCH